MRAAEQKAGRDAGKRAGKGTGNEQESPELRLSRNWDWDDGTWRERNGIEWVCNLELAELFELSGASRIVLVAKEVAGRGTYRVKLGQRCDCGCGSGYLEKPVNQTILPALARWLKVQAEAGRVHVGVRIVGD